VNILELKILNLTGNLKPAAAFMTGKLKIHGDLKKAMKLEKLMSSLKAKL
jgi:putative sterol carrier protein